ncbi:MAG: hypothetical protein V2A64_03075, partial [Candidatus Omnitrophota bacterium]
MSSVLVLTFRKKYLEIISVGGWPRIKLVLIYLGKALRLFMLSSLIIGLTIVLKIIQPFIKVHIMRIDARRIGNLAEESEQYLRRKALYGQPKREFNLVLSGRPANRQLLNMIKRKFFVLEQPCLLDLHRIAGMFIKNSKIWIYSPHHLNCVREY